MRPPRLTIVHGTVAPDSPKERVRKRLRAQPKPPYLLRCPRCAGHELTQTRIGVVMKNGKPTGGTKVLICAECQRNGERVVVA